MGIDNYVAAIGVLAVVIFVHELGHFLVAKWCDVEVQVFSIGFGPTLLSRTVGETEYRIAAIPLGGYVRMAGQDDSEDLAPADPTRGFSIKPLRQRAAIVAAGPGVNFLFAFLVFTGAAYFYGQQVPTDAARVHAVLHNAPADAAGLAPGDVIVSIDGTPVENWNQLHDTVVASKGRTMTFGVRAKDGATRAVQITPEKREQRDYLGEVIGQTYVIGIERDLDRVPVGAVGAVEVGAGATWTWTRVILETLGRLLQGRLSARDLGGPIMIAQEASRRADSGLEPLLAFTALISVNLAVINILPIPVLDGGHLFFFLIEGVRGRPISVRYRELAQQVGVFLLVALMVFVVFNDISRIVTG